MRCVAFRDWFAKRESTADTPADSASKSGGGSKRDFLEARQLSLFELFDGDTWKFDIPNYQRPYQWRSKQVRDRRRAICVPAAAAATALRCMAMTLIKPLAPSGV